MNSTASASHVDPVDSTTPHPIKTSSTNFQPESKQQTPFVRRPRGRNAKDQRHMLNALDTHQYNQVAANATIRSNKQQIWIKGPETIVTSERITFSGA
eukprot:CAMPEP_0174380928 /NCGR_PEP_ID=MMETSP0811_2-20130205/123682_1 /TAXON_ID=73025 ORGANISM="Eutreptiella gymnastica-like, Strain CCMP1594" /NCGR_SAMPLE_ID=MMETSP0811_2 /ASSEMBLY_ACC=CAM_ASM_000667 /LENGTH=97 /DNA_ID=CAMNT_0015533919 /DNA_START=2389 /DNA_END=2679 /DNA_ORIENTATION=+